MIKCDIAVIGAGAAGLSIAAGAAQMGADVVLVESHKMGGDCLNYGCVPSKALLAVAKEAQQVRDAIQFGIEPHSVSVNFSKVMQYVRGVIDKLAVHDSTERFEGLGVKVIQARAQFVNRKILQAGDMQIHAKRYVIATGSKPYIPPIEGLQDIRYLTNETIFRLSTLPEHLIVIGGGPIGCELAEAFALLGSRVTIIEAETILPKDEPDCVQLIRDKFATLDIKLHEQSQIYQASMTQKGEVCILIQTESKSTEVYGSHVLVATGRRTELDDLYLEHAGVRYSERGISVNRKLQTSNRKIYALGDVVGPYQFTHVASYQAGVVLRNILFRLQTKVNYNAVPWVTYTMPELAHVGMNEAEARKKMGVQVTEWPYSDIDRANTDHMTEGKIKIITDKTGKILGVTIVGAQAGELILPWVMAIREKKSLRSFTDVIVPYPTLSELSKRVAGLYYQPKLFSRTVRWLVKGIMCLSMRR